MEDKALNNDTFFCNIAELITELPTARGLAPRCKDYMCEKTDSPDIVVYQQNFNYEFYKSNPDLSIESINYLEAGWNFYYELLRFNGFYIHSSAVELDGRAYLFSGPCGTGKSTHTRRWVNTFEGARVFNDDKPALRKIDGKWYAYGTPFCGKDNLNINTKVQLSGICFLKQSDRNSIRRMTTPEAIKNIFLQSFYRFADAQRLELMAKLVEDVVKTIPIFELENLPDEAAARMSYETMRNAAKEAGL